MVQINLAFSFTTISFNTIFMDYFIFYILYLFFIILYSSYSVEFLFYYYVLLLRVIGAFIQLLLLRYINYNVRETRIWFSLSYSHCHAKHLRANLLAFDPNDSA